MVVVIQSTCPKCGSTALDYKDGYSGIVKCYKCGWEQEPVKEEIAYWCYDKEAQKSQESGAE